MWKILGFLITKHKCLFVIQRKLGLEVFFPQNKVVLFQIVMPVEGRESKHSWILSKGF